MTHAKMIIRTFIWFGKTRNSAILAKRMEPVGAPCQQLVRICLMTNIPKQFIGIQIEFGQQRQSELHNSQRRGKMATVSSHSGNYLIPYFTGQFLQFRVA